MNMKQWEAEFFDTGEPVEEPDYAFAAMRLRETLTPEQQTALDALLERFGELVRYERRWYYHKGYQAGTHRRDL